MPPVSCFLHWYMDSLPLSLQGTQFLIYRGVYTLGLPGGSLVKNLPAKQETQVQSLGREDPLEGNGNPLQYSCLGNTMDRRRSLAGYSPWGRERVGHYLVTK